MAATILDAPVEVNSGLPANFAVSASSDRRAFIFVYRFLFLGNPVPHTGITMGGQSMVLEGQAFTAGENVIVELWSMTESAIAAMSGSTITGSGGNTNDTFASVYFSVQDADQISTTLTSEVKPSSTSGSLSLVRAADSLTFFSSTHYTTNGFSAFTNPSSSISNSVTSGRYSFGSQADTDNTSDSTWANIFSVDNASLVFNIGPAASGTVTRDITINQPADVHVAQTMIAEANTNPGEGLADPALIDVEDNHQVAIPKTMVVGPETVTLTLFSDFTYTTDKNLTFDFDAVFRSPDTGQDQRVIITNLAAPIGSGSAVSDDSIVSGSGLVVIVGSGAAIASESTTSGSGLTLIVGSGAAVSEDSVTEGIGNALLSITGSGAAVSDDSITSGIGAISISGSGAMESDDSVTEGFGFTDFLGDITGKITIESATPIITLRRSC